MTLKHQIHFDPKSIKGMQETYLNQPASISIECLPKQIRKKYFGPRLSGRVIRVMKIKSGGFCFAFDIDGGAIVQVSHGDVLLDNAPVNKEVLERQRLWEKKQKEIEAQHGNYDDDTPFPFGTHEGTLMNKMPKQYFTWLLTQSWVHKKYPGIVNYINRSKDK